MERRNMGYTKTQWMSRIAHRNDVTATLIHLTRNQANMSVMNVLLKILTEKHLIGSTTKTGFIVGNRNAVCFQEAPLYSLTQNIYTEEQARKVQTTEKIRYLGF